MADLDFPSWLRTMITASKSRTTLPAFRTSDVFAGAPYIESITDDTPSIYDCSFKFDSRQKSAFWQWFISPDFCDKGRKPFNLNINVEGGYTIQECRFLADGTPQLVSEELGLFTYSARILVSQLNDPDNGLASDLVSIGNEFDGLIDYGLEVIDIAVNEYIS